MSTLHPSKARFWHETETEAGAFRFWTISGMSVKRKSKKARHDSMIRLSAEKMLLQYHCEHQISEDPTFGAGSSSYRQETGKITIKISLFRQSSAWEQHSYNLADRKDRPNYHETSEKSIKSGLPEGQIRDTLSPSVREFVAYWLQGPL